MSRMQKAKIQSDLHKLVKDINKKMDGFEDAVRDLKLNLDDVEERNAQAMEAETRGHEEIRKMEADFRENKLRTLTQVAGELNKVIITSEELAELRQSVQQYKTQLETERKVQQANIDQAVAAQVKQQVDIKRLENDCAVAQLRAEKDAATGECESLRLTIDRMSNELDSQKRLTADIAGVGIAKAPPAARAD